MLIDAGYYDFYGSSHFKNYYTRSIAHNIVTVFDSTEVFYYGNEIVSNDGGQKYSDPMMNLTDVLSTQFQRGRWLTYSEWNNVCYGAVDVSLSYNSPNVKKYTRRIIFQKPDKFIVLDNLIIKSSSPSGYAPEVRWLAHFKNQPQMNGQVIENIVPGHIETFNGKIYSATNGTGKISIKTLLPD